MKKYYFSYEGISISFARDEDILINTTDLEKAVDGSPISYYQSDTFINTEFNFRRDLEIHESQTMQLGLYDSQGYWMLDSLALVYANWLDPHLARWCLSRIKEIIASEI